MIDSDQDDARSDVSIVTNSTHNTFDDRSPVIFPSLLRFGTSKKQNEAKVIQGPYSPLIPVISASFLTESIKKANCHYQEENDDDSDDSICSQSLLSTQKNKPQRATQSVYNNPVKPKRLTLSPDNNTVKPQQPTQSLYNKYHSPELNKSILFSPPRPSVIKTIEKNTSVLAPQNCNEIRESTLTKSCYGRDLVNETVKSRKTRDDGNIAGVTDRQTQNDVYQFSAGLDESLPQKNSPHNFVSDKNKIYCSDYGLPLKEKNCEKMVTLSRASPTWDDAEFRKLKEKQGSRELLKSPDHKKIKLMTDKTNHAYCEDIRPLTAMTNKSRERTSAGKRPQESSEVGEVTDEDNFSEKARSHEDGFEDSPVLPYEVVALTNSLLTREKLEMLDGENLKKSHQGKHGTLPNLKKRGLEEDVPTSCSRNGSQGGNVGDLMNSPERNDSHFRDDVNLIEIDSPESTNSILDNERARAPKNISNRDHVKMDFEITNGVGRSCSPTAFVTSTIESETVTGLKNIEDNVQPSVEVACGVHHSSLSYVCATITPTEITRSSGHCTKEHEHIPSNSIVGDKVNKDCRNFPASNDGLVSKYPDKSCRNENFSADIDEMETKGVHRSSRIEEKGELLDEEGLLLSSQETLPPVNYMTDVKSREGKISCQNKILDTGSACSQTYNKQGFSCPITDTDAVTDQISNSEGITGKFISDDGMKTYPRLEQDAPAHITMDTQPDGSLDGSQLLFPDTQSSASTIGIPPEKKYNTIYEAKRLQGNAKMTGTVNTGINNVPGSKFTNLKASSCPDTEFQTQDTVYTQKPSSSKCVSLDAQTQDMDACISTKPSSLKFGGHDAQTQDTNITQKPSSPKYVSHDAQSKDMDLTQKPLSPKTVTICNKERNIALKKDFLPSNQESECLGDCETGSDVEPSQMILMETQTAVIIEDKSSLYHSLSQPRSTSSLSSICDLSESDVNYKTKEKDILIKIEKMQSKLKRKLETKSKKNLATDIESTKQQLQTIKGILIKIAERHKVERNKLSVDVKKCAKNKTMKNLIRQSLMELGERQKSLFRLFQKHREMSSLVKNDVKLNECLASVSGSGRRSPELTVKEMDRVHVTGHLNLQPKRGQRYHYHKTQKIDTAKCSPTVISGNDKIGRSEMRPGLESTQEYGKSFASKDVLADHHTSTVNEEVIISPKDCNVVSNFMKKKKAKVTDRNAPPVKVIDRNASNAKVIDKNVSSGTQMMTKKSHDANFVVSPNGTREIFSDTEIDDAYNDTGDDCEIVGEVKGRCIETGQDDKRENITRVIDGIEAVSKADMLKKMGLFTSSSVPGAGFGESSTGNGPRSGDSKSLHQNMIIIDEIDNFEQVQKVEFNQQTEVTKTNFKNGNKDKSCTNDFAVQDVGKALKPTLTSQPVQILTIVPPAPGCNTSLLSSGKSLIPNAQKSVIQNVDLSVPVSSSQKGGKVVLVEGNTHGRPFNQQLTPIIRTGGHPIQKGVLADKAAKNVVYITGSHFTSKLNNGQFLEGKSSLAQMKPDSTKQKAVQIAANSNKNGNVGCQVLPQKASSEVRQETTSVQVFPRNTGQSMDIHVHVKNKNKENVASQTKIVAKINEPITSQGQMSIKGSTAPQNKTLRKEGVASQKEVNRTEEFSSQNETMRKVMEEAMRIINDKTVGTKPNDCMYGSQPQSLGEDSKEGYQRINPNIFKSPPIRPNDIPSTKDVSPSAASFTTFRSAFPDNSPEFRQTIQPMHEDIPLQPGNDLFNGQKYPSLKMLVDLNILEPGRNVLSVTGRNREFRASLTDDGCIESMSGELFMTPVKWLAAVLGKPVPDVKKIKAYNEIHYKGRRLMEYVEDPTLEPLEATGTCSPTLIPSEDDQNNSQSSQDSMKWLKNLLNNCTIRLLGEKDLISNDDLPENFWTDDFSTVKLGPDHWKDIDKWD